MRSFTPASRWKPLASEAGFTLLEALAALALTAAVSTVVTSLILSMLSTKRAFQDQTDLNDSLRAPAAMIMRDVRYAKNLQCGWDNEFLSMDYGRIVYRFEDASLSDPSQPADLYRFEGGGGQIVGRGLQATITPAAPDYQVPPGDPSAPPQTWFRCDNFYALAHLVLVPIGGQQEGTTFEVYALKR